MPCPSQTSGFNVPNYVRKKSIFSGPQEKELRKRAVKCFVWSVALYGLETWTLRRSEEKRINAFEMWICRRLERVKWTDRIRNEAVLERIGHVLGFCRKTELLLNNRHHKARTGIADVLKRRGWEVYEEIHCVSFSNSNKRADIVAIHRTQSKGIVLDPTIWFERDALQAQHVDEEKKSIYESCIPYLMLSLKEKTNLYKQLILSILTYASPAWFYAPRTNLKPRRTTQNRALRIIHACDWFTSNTQVHEDLQVDYLHTHLLQATRQFYQELYFSDNPFNSSLGSYDSRQFTKFRTPKFIINP
ncbi:hypothetical protein ANN_09193 [Periplaneta americana]|uniref:Reverse transcriptase n=1 Tax=Periplaneta americana TaxID=6978 RepID=A0ABQ8TL18_PERAM|nr:hypothetical protein ANN_09193 [Periplaneta americana]